MRLIETMEEPTKTYQSVTAIVLALTVIVFVLDLLTPLGIAIWILYILPVGLTRWSPFRPLTACAAGACTALIMIGYFLSPPGIAPEIAVINRLLGVSMLWITALFVWFGKA
jgi:hypothetical protein